MPFSIKLDQVFFLLLLNFINYKLDILHSNAAHHYLFICALIKESVKKNNKRYKQKRINSII